MVGASFDGFSPGESPIGVVSGSGINLRPLLDTIYEERSFAEAGGLSGSGVLGHDGAFVYGRCAGVPVVLQAGRIHLYEGHTPEQVGTTVDVLHEFGVRTLILTNAVGGLDPALTPGSLVSVSEVKTWPYEAHAIRGPLAPDFLIPGCDATGRYMWVHGPCYETRAEIGALQRLGALAVGMSLPVELQRATALGIKTGIISCVTNDCTRTGIKLTHSEVVDTAQKASLRLAHLIRSYVTSEV